MAAPDAPLIFDVAPAEPTIDLRSHTCRRIARSSPSARSRLHFAVVAVGAHQGAHDQFVYYHRIRRLRQTPTGWTFTSDFAFVHRLPHDATPFQLIEWDPESLHQPHLPSPPPSPIVTFVEL